MEESGGGVGAGERGILRTNSDEAKAIRVVAYNSTIIEQKCDVSNGSIGRGS